MKIIKSFFIAFSIYSKIPVPQLEWKEEDMRYMLCFFPWIGAVIGGVLYLWSNLCVNFNVGIFCYTVVGAAIPLVISGGFHVDGFMDTMDAFHSYQPKERKLEILKDSHIGAFAVIMLMIYGLLFLGAYSEIRNVELLRIVCAGFFLSRSLSGIGVISFPSAKKEGSLYFFANSSEKRLVGIVLYLQIAACIGFMLLHSLLEGSIVVILAFLSFAYYYYRCKKELGGITGDTAGYFVLICELSMMIGAAVISVITR